MKFLVTPITCAQAAVPVRVQEGACVAAVAGPVSIGRPSWASLTSWIISLAIWLLSAALSSAMAAPGEDPVVLQGKVNYLQLPAAAVATSASIVHRRDLPDNAKAKIARYMAKSFSADTTGIQTEKDVVSTVRTNGNKTTCTQTLAPPPSSDPNSDQVVVIRGDLINICN